MSETIRRAILGVTVEVLTFEKGNLAFVFMDNELAGSVERDVTLDTWTALPLYLGARLTPADGMWAAVQKVVHAHVDSCVKAVLAR
jgi:hypothetical protein